MTEKIDDSSVKHRIKKMSFHVLSADNISDMSVVSVDTKTLYDMESRRPYSGGPLDLRLGVSVKTGICETCKESIQNCSGHFGQIKLFLPVYHIGFLKHTVSVLNCICKSCSSLLIGFNRKLVHSDHKNFELIKNECKNVKACPKCNFVNGTVKKNTGFRIYHEIKNNKGETTSYEINPQTCLNLFKKIDPEDYRYLGLSDTPENMIIQNLVVPPSCIRPSVDMQDEGFNEDDLTVKLSEIINTNKLLEESIRKGNSLPIINEDWDHLQLQVSLFINSDLPSVNMISTPIRGIVQRLKGKQGRFRCNLSGKRVDFSGRTVISPDPNLSVDEVGVPERIAKVLTVPEKVTHFNRHFLTKLVQNGVEKWPGANYIITRDEKGKEFKRFLMYGKNKELRVGDIVERHLLDGDFLLFNRQPSLHRMSIMGHKAKIHKHRTFRFNECCCLPYNADFDGDEMNIHLPQTLEARAEAENLMGIRHNICTARNNEPLISCTQDFLTGTYILTSRNTFFTRERFAQLCSYITPKAMIPISIKPVILSPVELFTGKQVYEVIFQIALAQRASASDANDVIPNITLSAKNRSFKKENDINEGYVQVLNGHYISGRLDKSIIGGENRKGSLIYQFLKISKDCAIVAMNSIARLSSRYLAERGFSIGLDDVFPSPSLIKEKVRIVNEVYAHLNKLIEEKAPDLEKEFMILNNVREDTGNVCIKELSKNNSPIIMQECGSKGSKINVSQMIACVGPQVVSGQRIANGMIDRTLPHFPHNCISAEAKGFVLNSFFSGLTGFEFFFHAVTGREGLVDTAVKTAETGYMQRRLMKALEDLSIKYDYTVRNSSEDLVQFKYGEDSVMTLKNEENEFFDWILKEAIVQCRLKIQNHHSAHQTLSSHRIDLNSSNDQEKNLDNTPFTQTLPTDRYDRADFVSADLGSQFSLVNILKSYIEGSIIEDPYSICPMTVGLLQNLYHNQISNPIINKRLLEELTAFVNKNQNNSFFCNGKFYNYFQNRLFISEFFNILQKKLLNMIIDPGAAVGAVAGQSIGEPGTQMTLKTFHFAGVASMNITLGVPRLKEIINASANIATPIISAKLQIKGIESAKIIKGRLEKLLFRDIVSKITHSTSPERMCVNFSIDFDLIKKLRLEISADKIATTINGLLKTTCLEVSPEGLSYVLKRVKENSFFQVEKVKKQILNAKINGLDGVEKAIINCINKENNEYELFVEAKCFNKVLNIPGIEPTTTLCNDILEVEKTLGIEAARALIIREVEYTMGRHGIKVDHRHFMLLADTMSFRGSILGITRFGIGKMRTSTLMLASFEQTADYLFNAAINGTKESVDGVSESIILGIPISLGTGSMRLLWNKEKIN